jgi:superfamily II DNA/RNA helicase
MTMCLSPGRKVIIVADIKNRVDPCVFTIERRGYPVVPIHRDQRHQKERDHILHGKLLKISNLISKLFFFNLI